MSLSMYQASVPAFLQTLNNLSAILDKAEAYAGNRKIDPEVLLNYRLAPDMLPFVRQIQIAADLAKGAAARLAGVEVPKHDDTEKTFADLKARITNMGKFVQSIQPSDIDGSEDRGITLTLGEHTLSFKGQPYLLHFVLPNFYFHCATAYDILRSKGVPLGKMDFLAGGQAALKSRPVDDRDEEIARLRAKVGELTMDNELLLQRCRGDHPFVPRRRKR